MIVLSIIVAFLCLITWLNWNDIRSVFSMFLNVDRRLTEIESSIKDLNEKETILKS